MGTRARPATQVQQGKRAHEREALRQVGSLLER